MSSAEAGRWLILIGAFTAMIGVAVRAGVPLGRLPGDIRIERDGMIIWLPITTSLLISLLIGAAAWFLRRL